MRFFYPLIAAIGLGACASTVEPPPVASAKAAIALEARADALFAAPAASHDLSGTLLVRSNGRTVFERRYGYADWQLGEEHAAQTRYAAASVTKGLTAAAVVELARAGKLGLDDPVAKFLPALAQLPGISIAQVLDHTAGLPRDLPDGWQAASVAHWLAANPDALGPVGEEAYSNVGYSLLAEIVEAVSGESFAGFVEASVLGPAGMDESVIDPATPPAGLASPYTAGPEPSGVMTAPDAPLEPGASGLVTSPRDLALWAEALAGGAYPEFFVPDDPLGSVDRGSAALGEYISVQGSLPGYSANAIAWNGGRDSVVFVGNLFSYPALSMKADLRALVGMEEVAAKTVRPAAVRETGLHTSLLGRYDSADFGPVEILKDPQTGSFRLQMIGKPAFWSFHLTSVDQGFHWRAFDRLIELRAGEAVMLRRGREEAKPMARRIAD